MTQPDTQSMRTLPPISSLAHADLNTNHRPILPATPRSTAHTLPNLAITLPTSSPYHPSPHEPVSLTSNNSHILPTYYPLHVTAAPDGYTYDRSPPNGELLKQGQMTSEQVLAEKRRRNAGASARFRDRRKQRERDVSEKCHVLEERVRELEQALSRATGQTIEEIQERGHKPALMRRRSSSVYSDESQDKNVMIDNFQSLGERVTELENLVGRSRREKDASVKKLQELEKENAYLRSLLIPASISSTSPIITNTSQAPSTPPLSVSASPPTSNQKPLSSIATAATADDVGEADAAPRDSPKRRKLDQEDNPVDTSLDQ